MWSGTTERERRELTPTTVLVSGPGNASALAEAVTSRSLSAVLNLTVVSGSFDHFGPGDIALSKTITGPLSGRATSGTRSRRTWRTARFKARIAAIYSRSLGFADALVPASAGSGGHLGSTTMTEVLVRGAPGVASTSLSGELAGLASRFAGLSVASRSVVNAQAQQYLANQSYANNLFLGLVVLLAAVALVNPLVMATVERRGALLLLRRVGATTRQLLSMTFWQTMILVVSGLLIGWAAAAASVLVVSKALADTWMPYRTWPPMVEIAATAVGLTAVAILVPTICLLTSDPGGMTPSVTQNAPRTASGGWFSMHGVPASQEIKGLRFPSASPLCLPGSFEHRTLIPNTTAIRGSEPCITTDLGELAGLSHNARPSIVLRVSPYAETVWQFRHFSGRSRPSTASGARRRTRGCADVHLAESPRRSPILARVLRTPAPRRRTGRDSCLQLLRGR